MIRVTVLIPGALRAFSDGRPRFALEIATDRASVRDALEALWLACPGLRDRILTEQGDLRPHVNVFVDADSVRWNDGFAMPVRDGAELAIFPAVSGG